MTVLRYQYPCNLGNYTVQIAFSTDFFRMCVGMCVYLICIINLVNCELKLCRQHVNKQHYQLAQFIYSQVRPTLLLFLISPNPSFSILANEKLAIYKPEEFDPPAIFNPR